MISSSEITERLIGGEIKEALFEVLVEEYQGILSAYHREDYEKTINKSGKFVETSYQILEELTTGSYSQNPSFTKVKENLRNLDSNDYPDSVRLLIPRLGKYLYDIRSRRGAVHQSEIDPMFMDAYLSIQITRWILAEFLRAYGDYSGDEEILSLHIEQLTTESLPLVEEFENGEIMLLLDPSSCKEEILILLYHFYPKRVTNSDLKSYLEHQTPSNIMTNLRNAEKDKLVHRSDEGSRLTLKGKKYVEENYGPEINENK